MTVRWHQLLVSLSLWLLAELVLNLVGIDDLVDYSEYLFERHAIVFLCLDRAVIPAPSVFNAAISMSPPN
ncbi:hypothetical protein [Acaryochloris marina]|uniref:hypothetical protein n=1 Tax=Acaryochloris marina TaxID=155978 RepID=UPI001BB090A4|nr:hypothetical protein [Acaryochloris marina]QUY45414.1 hypothetical protein I1H34_15240 [Acaryochloris marina S15]